MFKQCRLSELASYLAIAKPQLASMIMDANSPKPQKTTLQGFLQVPGPQGEPLTVPRFMVPAVQLQVDSMSHGDSLNIRTAEHGPKHITVYHDGVVAAGRIYADPEPVLSQVELLTLHAEIKALMDRYGLSYKDAAHRLYLAEIAKVEVLDDAAAAAHSALTLVQKGMVRKLDLTVPMSTHQGTGPSNASDNV